MATATELAEATPRKEVSRLKRVLADKTLELDFFKGALQKVVLAKKTVALTDAELSQLAIVSRALEEALRCLLNDSDRNVPSSIEQLSVFGPR